MASDIKDKKIATQSRWLRARGLASVKDDEGFTLVELAFYVSILSVVLTSIVSLLLTGTQAVAEHDTFTVLQERNRVSLFRITRDLRGALATSIQVDSNKSTLRLTLARDFDGTVVTPGDRIAYTFEMRQDGSNKGQLVRRNESTGEDVVICNNIDMATTSFEQNASGVDINVSNVGVLKDGSSLLTVSRSVTVFPRN